MGSNTVELNTVKLVVLSLTLPAILLFALVDVVQASGLLSPAFVATTKDADPLASINTQVITLPTPFPTPAPVTYTADLETAFWDVTNYEGAVSAIQTLFLLQGIQDIIIIIMWLGLMGVGFALIRGIIAGARAGPPRSDNEL